MRVLERARAIRSELEALRKDLSMLQGLETGHATLGVVGTVSRWLVPRARRRDATRRARRVAAAHRGRVGAARGEVAERELASAVVTEPVSDPRLVVEHLRDEASSASCPPALDARRAEPVPLADARASTA